MTSARRTVRASVPAGVMLACWAAVIAQPAWPQIQPQRTDPMQQDPATGLVPLAPPAPTRSRDRGPVVANAPQGAVLRMLDKISGKVADLALAPGGSARVGSLTVSLQECRYPVEDPTSNAYAYLIIRDDTAAAPLFRGWMIADSPALNALDHPRYDVWVRQCAITDAAEGSGR